MRHTQRKYYVYVTKPISRYNLVGYSVCGGGGVDYDGRHWNGLEWLDVRIKFLEDQFRHLSNIAVITAIICMAVKLVLLIEITLWYDFMWRDKLENFHEDWYECLGNNKGFPQIHKRLKFGISDEWIYKLRRWDLLRCCGIRTKLHNHWFRYSKLVKGSAYTDTRTARWSHKPTSNYFSELMRVG
jgi:hypothetical protein